MNAGRWQQGRLAQPLLNEDTVSSLNSSGRKHNGQTVVGLRDKGWNIYTPGLAGRPERR